MKNYKEYWVEYDWIDTPYGKRAMWIRSFKNKKDANDFAKSKKYVCSKERIGRKC